MNSQPLQLANYTHTGSLKRDCSQMPFFRGNAGTQNKTPPGGRAASAAVTLV